MTDIRSQKDFDEDPTETREWLEALASVIDTGGSGRAAFLLRQVEEAAQREGVVGTTGLKAVGS